jgi:hypothetical protein
VSDRRRQQRWSAPGASELPPRFERSSGAAVRSTDLVRLGRSVHVGLRPTVRRPVCSRSASPNPHRPSWRRQPSRRRPIRQARSPVPDRSCLVSFVFSLLLVFVLARRVRPVA